MAHRPIRVKGRGDLTIREYRSAVAALKRAGLVSAKIDARSHEPTRYMREQIARFSAVLDDAAIAVKVPRSKAREFAGIGDVKNDRVILVGSKARGEFGRYNPRTNEITVSRGNVLQRVSPQTGTDLPALKKGEVYAIPFRRGNVIKRVYSASVKFMTQMIERYEADEEEDDGSIRRGGKTYRGMRSYIQVVKVKEI